jgi:hypothetical protein
MNILNLPQSLTLIVLTIGIFLSIKLLKGVRQLQKANRAYRDALWKIRFCNEESPVLTYQEMESIALKALTENETERYAATLTENKE